MDGKNGGRPELTELSGQMRESLVYVYLGYEGSRSARSLKALERRGLILTTPEGTELTPAGLAYLSAYVQALRIAPAVLELDRAKYRVFGFKHMVLPEHLKHSATKDDR